MSWPSASVISNNQAVTRENNRTVNRFQSLFTDERLINKYLNLVFQKRETGNDTSLQFFIASQASNNPIKRRR